MKGPCAKQQVFCTLVHPDGRRWVGTNHCRTPQHVCPRADMPSGQGYELCKSVCNQKGHAEIVALRMAGANARGCIAYVEGHTYACESCRKALEDAGVLGVSIGSPPPLV